jgi:hypothetical protein
VPARQPPEMFKSHMSVPSLQFLGNITRLAAERIPALLKRQGSTLAQFVLCSRPPPSALLPDRCPSPSGLALDR